MANKDSIAKALHTSRGHVVFSLQNNGNLEVVSSVEGLSNAEGLGLAVFIKETSQNIISKMVFK